MLFKSNSMRAILAIIFMTFVTQASAECGGMCDRKFWLHATIADVKRAIDKGEDINQRNSQGNGPLTWASSYSDFEIFKFLIEQGADIHARNLSGHTPLVSAKDPEKVEYLIRLGADVDLDLKGGLTVFIFHSGSQCRIESLKLLQQAGANPYARNENGTSALHWAAMWSSPIECLDYLLETGLQIDSRTRTGNTPLHEAAQCPLSCKSHVIPWLLSKGADPRAKNSDGKTPWDLAQENEELKGSKAFWALNDAYYK